MILLRALRSEALKLVSVRLWWILALILLGYVGFTAGLLGGLFGALGGQLGTPELPPELLTPLVYSTATSVGYAIPVLLGALSTTAEFRHQTLTPTFLATPRRGVVLLAKVLVIAGAGAVFGLVGLLGSVGLGAPILGAVGVDPLLGSSDTWALAGRIVLAMAIWAVVGVGLGVLVPSQVAAIVIVLAFTQFLEPILRLGASIWEWSAQLGRFLPGAASDALVGASVYTTLGGGGMPGAGASPSVAALEWWQGGLVLLAIAVAVVMAGGLTTWRRDVS